MTYNNRIRGGLRAAGGAALLAALAAPTAGQGNNPLNQNDVPLNNGAEQYFFLSDPSVSPSYGAGPVDASGDHYWKVFPRDVLDHPSGTMEITGVSFFIADSDWTTPPDYWDVILARGQASVVNPGTIEPDFNDPAAIRLFFGNSGLPSPCSLPGDPFGCGGSPCPPAPGQLLGYNLQFFIGTGNGDGIVIPADGTRDYTVSAFPPPGQSVFNGPPGTCGLGDYSFAYSRSTDENLVDFLGLGTSHRGGFQIGNAGGGLPSGPIPDALTDAAFHSLEFFEPTLNPMIDRADGAGPRIGLAALDPPAAAGNLSFGLFAYSLQGIGNVCVCASSLSRLAAPGFPILGANIMLGVDPLFAQSPSFYVPKFITLQSNGGDPYDNGVYQSDLVAVPPNLAGVSVFSQCIDYDFLQFTGTSTNVVRTTFR